MFRRRDYVANWDLHPADFQVAVRFRHFFALGKVHRLGRSVVDVRPRPPSACGEGADQRFVGQHRRRTIARSSRRRTRVALTRGSL